MSEVGDADCSLIVLDFCPLVLRGEEDVCVGIVHRTNITGKAYLVNVFSLRIKITGAVLMID